MMVIDISGMIISSSSVVVILVFFVVLDITFFFFLRDTDFRKGTMCLFCVPIPPPHQKKKNSS